MVDNLETNSAASSDISESLREQILGKSYRRKYKPTTQVSNILRDYEVIPSKEISAGDNKSVTSYHTPLGGSMKAGQDGDSFFMVPKNTSKSSMKSQQDRNCATQTVAIQTDTIGTDPDLECKCAQDNQECDCPECEPNKCSYGYNKKKPKTEETVDCGCPHCKANKCSFGNTQSKPKDEEVLGDTTDFDNYTESSSQTVDMEKRQRNHCTCNCRPCDYDSSMTEQFSDSDDSYNTDFFDLPYQNNEEYLKLLRELEKKLIARNRDRVKKTMMEFERRSRQNQNLEKPIFDYSDDNASMLRKLASRSHPKKHSSKGHSSNHHKNSVCCKCGRNKKVNSDILQNEKRWDEMNFVKSMIQTSDTTVTQAQKRIERSLHKSHWQLDQRSGEWVKVACFQQTDFSRPSYGGDYIQDEQAPLPGNTACKKECHCRQKKRR